MKTVKALLATTVMLGVLGAAALVTGCKTHDEHEHGAEHTHIYTCPHHPEVAQDAPGDCPKCGMKLVHKE